MKCADCNVEFNDGVQCGACRRHLDFRCANISEVGYRKLGADRRATWKCPHCRLGPSSPGPAPVPPAPIDGTDASMLNTILNELRDIKFQLASLPTLIEDVKSVKRELSDLKSSCEFNSARLEDQAAGLATLELKIQDVEAIQSTIASKTNEITALRRDLSSREQWSRLNNVEIKGVPIKSGENLFSVADSLSKVVGYSFPKTQINYIARVPMHSSKDKSIIITFINRYIKEEFIAAARAKKVITAKDIGFMDSTQRIFINDHLTPESKGLLTKTKAVAKDKNYNYVWVKYCKIHVRKSDTARILIVTSENDLNKIV